MICTYCRDVSLSLFIFFFNDDVMFWEQGCTPSTCVHNRDWCCDENEPCTNACTEFWGSKSDHHFESSCQVCSSPPPPLLLNASTGRIFFSWEPHGEMPRPSEAGWSRCGPQWGAWTHLHTKRLESTQRKWCIIWYLIVMSFVNRVAICSLSSTFCHLLQHWRRSDLRLWSVH